MRLLELESETVVVSVELPVISLPVLFSKTATVSF